MKSLLEKQFEIDFSATNTELQENIFTTNQSDNRFRYWAREEGSIVSYNNRIYVRTTNEQLTAELKSKYGSRQSAWLFEVPNLKDIGEILQKYDMEITRMAPFFIPKKKLSEPVITDERFVFISKEEIPSFKYDTRIKEAFCYSKTDEDMLGLGYYEQGELKAVCGVNNTGQYVWEIGIEILDNTLEGRGLATQMLSLLTRKIQQEFPDIVPVYGTSFSHTKSMNVAINADYKLVFSELMLGKIKPSKQ